MKAKIKKNPVKTSDLQEERFVDMENKYKELKKSVSDIESVLVEINKEIHRLQLKLTKWNTLDVSM